MRVFINSFYYFDKKNNKNHIYRSTPVPFTGGKRRRFKIIRKIKTTQERRKSIEHINFVRYKRNSKNLPNSYDDFRRNVYRGWKQQSKKRKQWM